MYPKELNTLRDHIKAKRIDLGLFQKEVTKTIGVTTDTITNWEKNRNQPMYRHYPRIIEFLGYCPLELLSTFNERLTNNSFYLRMSQAESGLESN